jgi:DNA repair protein RadC
MEVTVVREIEVRFRGRGRAVRAALRNPSDASRFFRSLIGADVRENFLAVYLDGRHRPIGWRVVSIGTATVSLVHPRETFQPAVCLGAASLIVGHNHPSGDPQPSSEDISVTRRLARAGSILGIGLCDHIVLGGGAFFSLRDHMPNLFSVDEARQP